MILWLRKKRLFKGREGENREYCIEEYHLEERVWGIINFWIFYTPSVQVKLENVIADFLAVSPVSGVPVMPNVEQFKFEEMKTRIWEQERTSVSH